MRLRLLVTMVVPILFTGVGFADAPPSKLESGRPSPIVVFREAGFPSADTAAPPSLEGLFEGARFAGAAELPAALRDADPAVTLLVLSYGSAFPEAVWPDILGFLQKGGNLLVLGGRPFTRSAYRADGAWRLREYSVRFARSLMIDQYQETPGSEQLTFQSNPDAAIEVPAFAWKRAFSPVIRLSAVDLYHRGGSAGSLDARVQAMAWGVKQGQKLSAPLLAIDHDRNGFSGGRWIFLNAELTPDFYRSPRALSLLRALAARALRGSEEFTVRPVYPLYLPGEPVQLDVEWNARPAVDKPRTLRVVTFPQAEPQARTQNTYPLSSLRQIAIDAPRARGFQVVEAQVLEGNDVVATYRSGFWIRDTSFLRSGPRLSVNADFFELDGKPLAVVGTTYMSSEVQRLYFDHPNAYVWDRDLAQIHGHGMNMIRSGWWTGWDKLCDENGRPYERTLRTLEAFLMTARKNDLPVQFNFMAFLPDVLGGANAYLDPEAVRRQQNLVASVVARFHDIPWLAWDLINEPSFSQRVWTMRPNGDPIELERWNEWLARRYPDRAALAAAWNLPLAALGDKVALPEEQAFAPRGMYTGHNSQQVYDYFLFAQEFFAGWAADLRKVIRDTGSQQLVTIGQDEGGIMDRLSPAYWGESVDFTTNHSWWQNDHILWDTIFAKQPGKTLLIQETGLQRELNLDETARRTLDSEASLLERKIAVSFIQASGAIEWLWNTNSYMTESNETPIGAVRPDETEKPEARVLESFATFAKSLSPHLRKPQQPAVAVVSSQAAQFSVIGDFQLEAQRKAVRALMYDNHVPAFAIAEHQLDHLGSPKLAVLPSPQSLTSHAWDTLMHYVEAGGHLLITGPVENDEHWHSAGRIQQLGLKVVTEPLTYHNATLRLGEHSIALSFNQEQQSWLDALHFEGSSPLVEIPRGKGRIYWAAYPVELAEGTQAAAETYAYVLKRSGIAPVFEASLPDGVLVYPVAMEDAVLYVMVSDAADDADVRITDQITGTALKVHLPGQHAAMALIGKRDKAVLAKYGF